MATRRNLVTRPNFEGTVGWSGSGSGASVAASTEQAHSGTKSLKVSIDGTVEFQGATGGQITPSSSLSAGQVVALSYWLYVPSGSALIGKVLSHNIAEESSGGFLRNHQFETAALVANWQRVTHSWTLGASTTKLGFTHFLAPKLGSAAVWFIDDLMLEVSAEFPTYFDGGTALPGYTTSWEGTANNSVSKAEEQVAAGLGMVI